MRLPAWALTSTAQVLQQVKTPAGLGQYTTTWQASGEVVKCAHFPAGTRILEQAQLKGVKVAREVYLERADLNPQTNRIELDGVPYQITLVADWDGFTVLGVTT